jgi:hypothetical protein
MRVEPDMELTGAREGSGLFKKRRIASERSDIDMLSGVLGHLVNQVVDLLGFPGSPDPHLPLRETIWTARSVQYRVERNRAERDRRARRKAAKTRRQVA